MKKGPIILIGFLIITLIFILGVQYGKQVNTTEEALKLVMSLAPTPTVSVEPTPKTQSFTPFESTACGVSFIYPSELQPVKESSQAASFQNEKKEKQIQVTCAGDILPIPDELKSATTSVTIDEKYQTGYFIDNDEYILFTMRHPTKKFDVVITVFHDLLPLVEKTLEFTN